VLRLEPFLSRDVAVDRDRPPGVAVGVAQRGDRGDHVDESAVSREARELRCREDLAMQGTLEFLAEFGPAVIRDEERWAMQGLLGAPAEHAGRARVP